MDRKIHTESTSKHSARVDDIVLRVTSTTRRLFRPEIIDNPNDPRFSVKGTLVHQRKGKAKEWEDLSDQTLSQLRSGEGIKIPLHSEEVYKLVEGINELRGIHAMHGVPRGKKTFEITEDNIDEAIEGILGEKKLLSRLVKGGGSSMTVELLRWFSEQKNPESVVEQLQSIDSDLLPRLSGLVGLTTLKTSLDIWRQNKRNNDEEFWHKMFVKNPFLLEHLFSCSVNIFADKALVGGKTLLNQHGKIIDFLIKNEITDNVALLEIKNPTTSLIGTKYRSSVYSLSSELSGTISQLLSYHDSMMKNFIALKDKMNVVPRLANPRCIAIIGTVGELRDDAERLNCFERIRNDSRNIEIVGFDEVFRKVEKLIGILEEGLKSG